MTAAEVLKYLAKTRKDSMRWTVPEHPGPRGPGEMVETPISDDVPNEDTYMFVGTMVNDDGNGVYDLYLYLDRSPDDPIQSYHSIVAEAHRKRVTLPTIREMGLLIANAPHQFTDNYYWSATQSDDGRVWCQMFHGAYNREVFAKNSKQMARFVKRVYRENV